jgi:hypothetical protein
MEEDESLMDVSGLFDVEHDSMGVNIPEPMQRRTQ